MNTKHGVVANDRLYLTTGFFELDSPYTLHKLCMIASKHNLTHLWVMPHEHIFNTRNSYFMDASNIDWNLLYTWQYQKETEGIENHLRGVYGWGRAEDKHSFYIQFIGPWNGWKFARTTMEPKKFLWVIGHLEDQLNIPLTGSPGTTGQDYLKKLHPKSTHWFNPPGEDLTKIPFEKAARVLSWSRELTGEESERVLLVKIDKNSAFPRAGVEYKFGTSKPIHRIGNQMFDAKLPGIWNCNIYGTTDARLPAPTWKDCTWLATPIVKRLIDTGHTVEVIESWVFEDTFHVFKTWAENLWAIRAKYPEGDPRRDAIKQILTDTIGLYRSEKMGDVFERRPDWYCQVVGGTRAIMLQNCESFVKRMGLYPVLVSTDAILYASDVPLSELLPDNRETLGGYKHVWQMPLTDEVRGILNGPGNAASKMGKLNKIAGEE